MSMAFARVSTGAIGAARAANICSKRAPSSVVCAVSARAFSDTGSTTTPPSSPPSSSSSPSSSSAAKLPVPAPSPSGYSGKGHDLFDPSFLDETGNKRMGVRGYGQTSFMIDDTLVKQSVLLMPHSFLLWNARTFEDITLDSLHLFPFLFPAVEVVFVGCGEKMPRLLPPEVYKTFRSRGIVVEATNTINAAASFNILNAEGRNVCAALLTLSPTGMADPVLSARRFREEHGM